MIRCTYYLPKYLKDKIEAEAKKRLIEQNKVGSKLLGSYSRDIICICIQIALRNVKNMDKEQFAEMAKQIKNKQ